jgi:hypothetical protein
LRRYLRRLWPLSLALISGCNQPQTFERGNGVAEAATTPDGYELGTINASMRLPEGPLSADALLSYIKAVFTYPRKDEFSKRFDDHLLAGRYFDFKLPSSTMTGPAYWYDPEKEVLTVWLTPDWEHVGEEGANMVTLLNATDLGDAHPESNAYGATVDVTPKTITEFGVGSVGKRRLGLFPRDPVALSYGQLSKTIHLGPEAARSATKGLMAEVKGVVVKGASGNAVDCLSGTASAKLDDPYDTTTRACVVNSKLSEIVISSPTAGVLGRWVAH